VRAGDLVIVRAGHYAGLYLTTSGTATDPITFRGDPGAIVDTQNPTTPDGINLEGASYVVIENFSVTGLPRAGIRSVLNHNVTIRGNTGDLNGRWGKRSHLVELRSAVAAVFTARGLSAPTWTDPTITPAVTVARAVHITELRAAVLALE
jgi:hypothetical protein